MTNNGQALDDVFAQLKAAWNKAGSLAWANLFSKIADFVHVFGGHFMRSHLPEYLGDS